MNYKPNRRGLEQLATGPQMVKVVEIVAAKAKAIAVALSQDFKDSGEYADSFEVHTTEIDVNVKFPHRAAAGVLKNTAGYAASVEWGRGGTANEPSRSAHRVLGRTLGMLH